MTNAFIAVLFLAAIGVAAVRLPVHHNNTMVQMFGFGAAAEKEIPVVSADQTPYRRRP